jgi:hypothetical protein
MISLRLCEKANVEYAKFWCKVRGESGVYGAPFAGDALRYLVACVDFAYIYTDGNGAGESTGRVAG